MSEAAMRGTPAVARGTDLTMSCECTLSPPSDVTDRSVDLFRSPGFFELHRFSTNSARYLTIRRADGTPWGAGWMGEIGTGAWRSPVRGPYGFVQPLGRKHRLPEFDAAVAAFGDALVSLGARSAEVILPPASHDPEADAFFESALARQGWLPRIAELNFAIAVSDAPLEPRMNDGNRETVRRAPRKRFVVRPLESTEFAEAFEVIAQNRRRRGRVLTMSLDAFTRMHSAMPGRLLWHGVFHEGAMIAASISMVVSDDVLYISYWGERDGAERHSPVTLLTNTLYGEAHARGMTLLDVGISTEQGEPNPGLVRYKQNVGCTVSLRATYTRRWGVA